MIKSIKTEDTIKMEFKSCKYNWVSHYDGNLLVLNTGLNFHSLRKLLLYLQVPGKSFFSLWSLPLIID